MKVLITLFKIDKFKDTCMYLDIFYCIFSIINKIHELAIEYIDV